MGWPVFRCNGTLATLNSLDHNRLMDPADDALTQARQQCDDGPPSVDHHAHLARLLERTGLAQEALAHYIIATLLQALTLLPADAASWLQLGLAFHDQNREDRARLAFRAALLIDPAMAEAWNNFGSVSDGEAAIAAMRHAVVISPARPDFHSNLAHALLAAGDPREGFQQWEWRTRSPQRSWPRPDWRGEPISAQSLLVYADQGYGDAIQFARYLPLAASCCAHLVLETRPALSGLLARIGAAAEITLWGDPLPACDAQVALPSLAAWLPRPDWRGPYLRADPQRREIWRPRLAGRGGRRIGLAWSGNAGGDRRRNLPFQRFVDLARLLPKHDFFGLQRDLPDQPHPLITQWGGEIQDFDDLAAAMMEIDLLICSDSAAAHLAGALGVPVWVLLRHGADWRWRGDRPEISDWYPTASLYRQQRPGDWVEPLRRVMEDLS